MNYKIELSDSDIELIGAALDDLPFKKVVDLSRRFQAQIDAQNAAERKAQADAQADHLKKLVEIELAKQPAKPTRAKKG